MEDYQAYLDNKKWQEETDRVTSTGYASSNAIHTPERRRPTPITKPITQRTPTDEAKFTDCTGREMTTYSRKKLQEIHVPGPYDTAQSSLLQAFIVAERLKLNK